MKLEVIRLIEDWEENSDGTIGCYGVEREVISATTISVRCEALEGGHTDWTFEANARTYLSPAVGEGLTGSIDRRWCCTCAQSCHPGKIDQECEVWEKNEIVPTPS